VSRRLVLPVAAVLALLGPLSVPARAADWSPERAARYLDGRLEEWFAWKPAASPDGPCVSCHTGMTYLLARPALRRRLGEPGPTSYETGLLTRLRVDVGAKPASYLQGVEVIFAAFFLSARDAGDPMSTETRRAFEQLWALQRTDDSPAGGWDWLTVDLDPWEHAESAYFGAALAALAVGHAGRPYADDPAIAPHLARLKAYLHTPSTRRPLHDDLALLWASSANRDVLSAEQRRALIDDVLARQEPDGGWTTASLGPWTPHARQPAAPGSSSYATGWVAYVLQRAGVAPAEPRLARAIDWLQARQDRQTGAWPAVSMNKPYPTGSMESLFMQDAATAFASLALLEAGR
jgi:squalene-hopene/tetraprenyl-beta-curcumene cyclase